MRLLLVKTSSMGDLLHTFPAVSDVRRYAPQWEVTWVAEEKLADIPRWHPGVSSVIPISLRRWRRQGIPGVLRETGVFARELRSDRYDVVVDAQGLLKSAWLVALARKAESVGYDWASAREPLASVFYRKKLSVSKDLHAVTRTRMLLAGALGYSFDENRIEFGIREGFRNADPAKGLVFVIGSSAESRLWALGSWKALARIAAESGHTVKVVWGSDREKEMALQIQNGGDGVRVAEDRQNIEEIAGILANAEGVVGVDTGFTHIASALEVPTVALYGSTSPGKSGLVVESSRNLQPEIECHPCNKRICPLNASEPPCREKISPDKVWEELMALLDSSPRR
jgi:heptosyltransferase-1